MPSTSARFRPASAIASSAALLMRSSDEEPSCLPNAVRPTPVIKLMAWPIVAALLPSPLGGGGGGGGNHDGSICGLPPTPSHQSELRSSRPRKGGGRSKAAFARNACVSLPRVVGRRPGDAIAHHRSNLCCGESGFARNLGAVLVQPRRQPCRLGECLR